MSTTKSEKEPIQQNIETREQKVARMAQVLDRGMLEMRLNIPLPEDVVGQWVPKDKFEIARMETLGYKVDKEYGKNSALHGSADGTATIGDCVLMTTSAENKSILDEAVRRQYERMHGTGKSQKEEKDFEAQVNKRLGLDIINEGSAMSATGDDVAAIVESSK